LLILNYFLIILAAVIVWKILRQFARERAEKLELEKQKAKDLARLEEYFRDRPPLWRLYEYARNCGIGFEIQPARQALDDILCDSVNWACIYFQTVKKTKKGIRIFEFREPQIVVPLDVLTVANRQTVRDYFFLVERLQDLADSLEKGRDLTVLEIMLEYTKNLERKIREINEESLKTAIFSFSHEIGHWKLVQKESGGRLITCPLIIEGGSDFPGCLLKELAASLEGLAILGEWGLSEYVDRELLLREKKAILKQCDYCRAEIDEGRCPAAGEIEEALKNFS